MPGPSREQQDARIAADAVVTHREGLESRVVRQRYAYMRSLSMADDVREQLAGAA